MLFSRKSFLFMIPSSNPVSKVAVLRIRIRRIRIFLDLPDPNLLAKGTDPDPTIIMQKEKEKPWFLLFCDFFFDFLSLKNYVNVASKSNKQDNLEKIKFEFPSWRSLTKKAGSGSGSENFFFGQRWNR